jgi:ribokinase
MQEAGLDLRYVERAKGQQTLFAICLIYPDGSGGNLTVNDSACAHVDAAFVARAEPEFARFAGRGIALALPEVPLEARLKLLELGTQYGFLRLDEAAAVLTNKSWGEPVLPEIGEPEGHTFSVNAIVEAAVQTLSRANPRLLITITAGCRGSWSWDGTRLVHVPAYPAAVVSTAGAGDAHLAGILVGLTAGLPLAQAHELGALVAALSITSPHTINKEINRASLRAFAATMDVPLSQAVVELLNF